ASAAMASAGSPRTTRISCGTVAASGCAVTMRASSASAARTMVSAMPAGRLSSITVTMARLAGRRLASRKARCTARSPRSERSVATIRFFIRNSLGQPLQSWAFRPGGQARAAIRRKPGSVAARTAEEPFARRLVEQVPPRLGAEVLTLAEAGKARPHLLRQVGWQEVHRRLGHHQAFGRDALGIDDLVPVEDEAVVVDISALAPRHAVAVHEVLGLHEKLRRPTEPPGTPLIEKDAVVRADDQVGMVAERARGDDDGREGTPGAQCRLADPADFLRAVVARQDPVSRLQC